MLALSLLATLFATSSASGATLIIVGEPEPFTFMSRDPAREQREVQARQLFFFQQIVQDLQEAAAEQLMFEKFAQMLEQEEQKEREFAEFIAFGLHNPAFMDELRFGNPQFFGQFYAQPEEAHKNFGEYYPEAQELLKPRYEDVAFPTTADGNDPVVVSRKEAEDLVAARIALGQTTQEAETGKKLNYFTALGLEATATQADIKKVYKKLSLLMHPDKAGGNQYEDAFKALSKIAAFADTKNHQEFANYQAKLQQFA